MLPIFLEYIMINHREPNTEWQPKVNALDAIIIGLDLKEGAE